MRLLAATMNKSAVTSRWTAGKFRIPVSVREARSERQKGGAGAPPARARSPPAAAALGRSLGKGRWWIYVFIGFAARPDASVQLGRRQKTRWRDSSAENRVIGDYEVEEWKDIDYETNSPSSSTAVGASLWVTAVCAFEVSRLLWS
ncbi:hypothetical protein EVAR_60994_1 [Eumeta japonica]|uniref:Uncharacterized protein n=1 Tax=Eumeta variegata TaxID=151549 RepID=A0A4C1ZRE7_EUMVA|nr:hypothetical protein EVAR_60994_1 [Eumeta japonica]